MKMDVYSFRKNKTQARLRKTRNTEKCFSLARSYEMVLRFTTVSRLYIV